MSVFCIYIEIIRLSSYIEIEIVAINTSFYTRIPAFTTTYTFSTNATINITVTVIVGTARNRTADFKTKISINATINVIVRAVMYILYVVGTYLLLYSIL